MLVIGVDGFRPDYAERFDTPNLRTFLAEGARAEALIPCYPSTTFPNFVTIATGLTPAQHGITEMDFYDPARGQRWFYQQAESTRDGSWYSGTPIWVLAERAGVRTATYFWPGADAEIGGIRPSFYRSYDSRVTHEQKLAALEEWLNASDGKRPRLMMMYFSDIDSIGHRYGPDSTELREAVEQMDATLGRVFRLVDESEQRLNVLIVSDHGMSKIERRIDLSALYDFQHFRVINNQFMVQLYSDNATHVNAAYTALQNRSPHWTIFRREQLSHLGYTGNARVGDLVIVPNGRYLVGINQNFPDIAGMHGYDPQRWKEMHGVLYARGEVFKPGAVIPAVWNTNLHALMAGILGLKPAVALEDRRILNLLKAEVRNQFK